MAFDFSQSLSAMIWESKKTSFAVNDVAQGESDRGGARESRGRFG